MKTQNTKQVAKMVLTLNLFVALSVGAGNVFAFPVCSTCKPRIVMSASVQSSNSVLTQVSDQIPVKETAIANTPAENPVGTITLFWARLALLLTSLF